MDCGDLVRFMLDRKGVHGFGIVIDITEGERSCLPLSVAKIRWQKTQIDTDEFCDDLVLVRKNNINEKNKHNYE